MLTQHLSQFESALFSGKYQQAEHESRRRSKETDDGEEISQDVNDCAACLRTVLPSFPNFVPRLRV